MAGVNSDTVSQVCDDVGLHQLAEELLLPGDVVSPGLRQSEDKEKVSKAGRGGGGADSENEGFTQISYQDHFTTAARADDVAGFFKNRKLSQLVGAFTCMTLGKQPVSSQ